MGQIELTPAKARAVAGLVVGLLCGLSVGLAQAAEVEVRVIDRAGPEPLPDASVCLGTRADVGQIGAYLTGPDGTAVFRDVPSAPLLLTVSKNGYKGRQRELESVTSDHIVVVQLARGGLGPQCEGAVAQPGLGGGGRLAVGGFRLDGGAEATQDRTVRLDFDATGGPTHYRVSEDRDFPDAQWRVLADAPTYRLSPRPGRKTVYLQLRRQREMGGSTLETTSDVVRDSIVLE